MDRWGRVLGIWRRNDCEAGFQRYDDDGCLIWAVDADDIDMAVRVVDGWRRRILSYRAWMDPEATRELFRVKEKREEPNS